MSRVRHNGTGESRRLRLQRPRDGAMGLFGSFCKCISTASLAIPFGPVRIADSIVPPTFGARVRDVDRRMLSMTFPEDFLP
jgi:hypothetical protein